jgi:hypothetical protein
MYLYMHVCMYVRCRLACEFSLVLALFRVCALCHSGFFSLPPSPPLSLRSLALSPSLSRARSLSATGPTHSFPHALTHTHTLSRTHSLGPSHAPAPPTAPPPPPRRARPSRQWHRGATARLVAGCDSHAVVFGAAYRYCPPYDDSKTSWAQ